MKPRITIPSELRNRPRWFPWKMIHNDKMPLCKWTDPANWKPFDQAVWPGKGFALGDGIMGIDMDSCRDPATGEIRAQALEIIKTLNSYTEMSPSGTGFKIYLLGAKPAGMGRCVWKAGLWEKTCPKDAELAIYDEGRWFAVTGNPMPGFSTMRALDPEVLARIVAPLPVPVEKAPVETPHAPRELPDDKLVAMLTKMPATKRAMELLYEKADREAFKGKEPEVNESKCDFILLSALCRLSRSRDQIFRVFAQSDLYRTKDDKHLKKWQERDDYPERSLDAARSAAESARLADNGLNFDVQNVLDDKDKLVEVKIPLPMDKVEARVRGFLGDEFAVVAGQPVLIQERMGSKSAHAMDTEAFLFAHLGRKHGMLCRWAPGLGMVLKSELLASLTLGGPHYWRVNEMPHEPALPDELYCCPKMPDPDMAVLEEYLGFFNFRTPEDRDLFIAYVATPFWGGPGGARPLFVFTSADGKGVGKSTAMEAAGKLVGTDSLAIPPDVKDIQAVVTRMFGAAGKRKRVLTIDNLTGHLKSDELTSLITSSTVSGRENYMGEGTRPNTMTYVMSLNSPELDNDLAIRSVEIEITKPTRSAEWEPRYAAFLREKRLVVVSTLLYLLKEGRGSPSLEMRDFRFATWADQVLRKCALSPGLAYAKACLAQNRLDADEEDIEQFMFDLRKLATERVRVSCGEKANLSTHRVWIQNGVVAEIYRRATQRKWANNTVFKHLHGLVSRKARGIAALASIKTTVDGESVRGFSIGGPEGGEKNDCHITSL